MKRHILFGLIAMFSLGVLTLGVTHYFFSGESQSNFENQDVPLPPAGEETPSALPAPTSEPKPSEETPLSSPSNSIPDTFSPSKSGTLVIHDHLLPLGYRVPSSPRTIDTIVLHSSYNAIGGDPFDSGKIYQEWQEEGVAPHYFIDRDGNVFRTVAEKNIAYHAGSSVMPDGRKNVNDFSIGIELDGTMTSGFTDAQYTSLRALIADIKTRNKISSIVGHSDIAPGRKTDPWQFDWEKLK